MRSFRSYRKAKANFVMAASILAIAALTFVLAMMRPRWIRLHTNHFARKSGGSRNPDPPIRISFSEGRFWYFGTLAVPEFNPEPQFAENSLISLARPEGFEHPTLRSVVEPQDEPRRGRPSNRGKPKATPTRGELSNGEFRRGA
jgi:hypothetical protein